ncbi:MAG TPA: NAD(P)/FAD-dependent oxidoreductase [Acidisphaera sp.]|nr:NAD(P)/FAD-dependent oxidoreductase [Acidisphaera sp.]
MTIDPASVAGKTLDVAERTDVLVVGAGGAGIAAALDARRQGAAVVLVDENPVPAETMGDDIPMLWGGAASGAARNRTAMTEALLAARPGLATAVEAGVDVRLGTSCWGLYANGPSVGWLPGPIAGLADETRAWLLGVGRVVVAAGCRDMGVAFAGWDLPGVAGVQAAASLAALGAFAPRRAVLLGTSDAALAAADILIAAGVTIVAVVEVAAPLADAGRLGAPVLCGHRVVRAEGGIDGVTALVVASATGERRLACDAVLLGIGTVPVIELLDAAGCRIVFDPGRGHVPLLDAAGRTSLPFVSAVGGCAGDFPAQPDIAAYRMAWVEALVLDGADDVHVCRCEDVTARDILHLRPPRYLHAPPSRRNDASLRALLGEGPPNPDQVKRLTRAGMGVCQGRRCREQVACLLALGTGEPLASVPLATHRAPVRPLPLRLAQAVAEPPDMRRHWDTWFGMYAQYVPYWDVAPTYTAATRPRDPDDVG